MGDNSKGKWSGRRTQNNINNRASGPPQGGKNGGGFEQIGAIAERVVSHIKRN